MTISTDLKQILVSAVRGRVELEGISVYHSAWPAPQHFTASIHPGFTAELETSEVVEFIYLPIKLTRASQEGNLSQRFSIVFQDLNTIIAPLVDSIPISSTERPQIEIRSFVYNGGEVSALADGPYRLQVTDSVFTPDGFKVTAAPRNVNSTGTGRRMTVQRFPMMRGFTR